MDEGTGSLYKFTKAGEAAEAGVKKLGVTSKLVAGTVAADMAKIEQGASTLARTINTHSATASHVSSLALTSTNAAASQLAQTVRYHSAAAGSVAVDLAKIEQAAAKTVPGLGKVERAMSALTFAAAGVPGPIGSLAGAILQLGITGPQVIGMLAAGAVLGLMLNKMGQDAKETAERLRGVREELNKLLQTAAGQAQLQKGVLSEAQSAREVELAYRQILLATAQRAGNAQVVAFQEERIAALLTEQKKDAVLFGQAQKVIDEAHKQAVDDAVAKQKIFTDLLNDAMKASSQISKDLAESAGHMIKAAEEADKWKLSFTDGVKRLRELGFLTKPGQSEAIIAAGAGSRSFGLQPREVKDSFHEITEIEKEAIREMQQDFGQFFDDLLTDGLSSFDNLFNAIRSGFTKLVADMVSQQLMKRLTTQDAAGNVTGLAAGVGTAGPILAGAAIAAGMIANHFKQAEEAARQIREDFDSLTRGLRAFHDAAQGKNDPFSGIADQANRLRDEARKLRDEQIEAVGGRNEQGQKKRIEEFDRQFNQTFERILADELTYIETIKKEQEAKKKVTLEDYAVRLLRAQGRGDAADDLAFRYAQERELAGVTDDVTRAKLQEVQAYEAAYRQTQKAIEAKEREADVVRQALEETTRTVNTLRDFARQLRGQNASPWDSIGLAKTHFDELVARARAGDQSAAAQLPGAGQQFLDYSREYNASGVGYQNDLKYVLDIIDSLGDTYDVQRNLEQMQLDALNAILDELKRANATWVIDPGYHRPNQPGGGLGGGNVTPTTSSDPANLAAIVPVLVTGFETLEARIEEQNVKIDANTSAIRRAMEGVTR